MLYSGQEDANNLKFLKYNCIRDCYVLLEDVRLDKSLNFVNNTAVLPKSRNRYTCYICCSNFYTELDLQGHKTLHCENETEDAENKSIQSENDSDYCDNDIESSENDSSARESDYWEYESEDETAGPANLSINNGDELACGVNKISGSTATALHEDCSDPQRNTPNLFFRCVTCKITFETYHELRTHKPKENKCKFSCKLCHRLFKTVKIFMFHITRHVSYKFFKCERCDIDFKNYYQLNNHEKVCNYLQTNSEESTVKMAHLNNTNVNIKTQSCDDDIQIKTEITQLSCELCYDVCNSEVDLKTHMEFHKQLAIHDENMETIENNENENEIPVNSIQNSNFPLHEKNKTPIAQKSNQTIRVDHSLTPTLNVGQILANPPKTCSNKTLDKLNDRYIRILPKQPNSSNKPVCVKQLEKKSYINTNSKNINSPILHYNLITSKSASTMEKHPHNSLKIKPNLKSIKINKNTNLPTQVSPKINIAPSKQIDTKNNQQQQQQIYSFSNMLPNGCNANDIQTIPSTSNSIINVPTDNLNINNNLAGSWTNNGIVGNSNLIYIVNPINSSPVVNDLPPKAPSTLIGNPSNIDYFFIPHNANTNMNFSASNPQMGTVNNSVTEGLQLFSQANQTSSTLLEQNSVLSANISDGLQLFTQTNSSTLYEQRNVLNTSMAEGLQLFTQTDQNSFTVLKQNNIINTTNGTEGLQLFAQSNHSSTMLEQNNIVYTLPTMKSDGTLTQKNNIQSSSNVSLMSKSSDNNLYYITTTTTNQSSESTKTTLIPILPKPMSH